MGELIKLDESISPKEIKYKIEEIDELIMVYSCAIKEISTKLEILDLEFKIRRKRNPIEYMKSRVKSHKSMMDKLQQIIEIVRSSNPF